jgi:hypothetical protein
MDIAKILIVITHEPADKEIDGSMTTGEVREVYANLPSRYLDVVIKEWEVTERDQNGAAVGRNVDPSHPRGEAPFLVETDPPFATDAENQRVRDDGIEEWSVMFWHGDKLHTALVLKARDVIVAAQRVKKEFPLCRIVHIDEVYPEAEHPMAVLDEYQIILPVGGPRVPKVAESSQ